MIFLLMHFTVQCYELLPKADLLVSSFISWIFDGVCNKAFHGFDEARLRENYC